MSTQTPSATYEAKAAPPPPAAPRRKARRVPDWSLTAALAIALIALAELSARQGWVSDLVLPAPSGVYAALLDGFSSGIFWPHLVSTFSATLLGFVLASIIAIVLSGLLTSIPVLERTVLPFIFAFQTLPKIAVAPLVILWIGFGFDGKVVIVVLVCFFAILVPSLQGLKIRERDQLELMKSLGASKAQLFRYLRMRNAVPYIFAGLQVGMVFSLIGAVTAEFVGSRAGLGYILLQNKAQFNVPGVFAILVLLMVIGLILNAALRFAERKIAFWTQDISNVTA